MYWLQFKMGWYIKTCNNLESPSMWQMYKWNQFLHMHFQTSKLASPWLLLIMYATMNSEGTISHGYTGTLNDKEPERRVFSYFLLLGVLLHHTSHLFIHLLHWEPAACGRKINHWYPIAIWQFINVVYTNYTIIRTQTVRF